jgi:TonB family protein
LSFVVGADGNVRDPKILISSGSKELDDASLQCVMRWRYMPLSRDEKPYDVMWQAGVYWKPGYPPDVSRAEWCLAFRKGERAIPKGVANTSVTFRVMPDGTMKDTSIARSSGDRSLDEAAIRCMNSGYFDTSILTLPTEGIAGHADLDWAQAAPLPPPLPPLPPLSSTPPK